MHTSMEKEAEATSRKITLITVCPESSLLAPSVVKETKVHKQEKEYPCRKRYI